MAAAALALASCGADPTCKSLGAEEYDSSPCFLPQFTEDPTALCVSVGDSGAFVVDLYFGCNGFDVIEYPATDIGTFALYRPPDDRRFAIGSWGPVAPPHLTIEGVPELFDLSSCPVGSTIRCAPP